MPRQRGFKWDNREKKQYIDGSEINFGGVGGGSTNLGDTPPLNPVSGDTWFDTSTGAFFVYYSDGTSNQWVGVSGPTGDTATVARENFQVTTASIANDVAADVVISLTSPGYILYKIQTDAAAWVRLYTDTTSRTNDSARDIDTDPINVEGLVSEVITTGAQTINLSPGVILFNNESPVTDTLPITVVNKSGANAAITVTITAVQIES